MTEPQVSGRHAAAAEPLKPGAPAAPGGIQLPEPTVLRQYDEVLPGFARQVLDAAREEVVHRRRLQRAESQRQTLGQVFALVLALSFLLAAYLLVNRGHDAAGAFLGAADIGALVTAFILGRTNR